MPGGAGTLAEIARGKIPPVLYLAGEERFLVDRTLGAVRDAVLGKGGAKGSLSYDLLVAREAGPAGILAAARTLPMLAKRRLVVVREAEALAAKDLAPLMAYARDPNPATVLVLVGEKADMRTKFFGEIDRMGALLRFDRLRERDAAAWVSAEARTRGVAIDEDAVALLADAIGADLGALAQSLERLALYAGAGATVRARDVEETIVQVRARSVFELCAAVGRGDLREALVVLDRMRDDRQQPVGIVSMLARHFRQIWTTREMKSAGASDADVAARLGIPPFFVRPLVEQARRFSPRALRRAHEALLDADRRLKSSRLDPQRILEACVLRLVGLVRSGAGPAAGAGGSESSRRTAGSRRA